MGKLAGKKGGIESGIETALVLSGITSKEDLAKYPYQPNYVLDKADDIIRDS